MSSAEDADDERESRLQTPVADYVDRKTQKFTVFVVLPNGDVCTLRELPSGISVFDVKGRLELSAGVPSQIYNLIYPDGEELEENQKLHVHENVLNGYLLKMQLRDNWESLYTSMVRNNIEHVNHGGGVHLRGKISVSPRESDRYEAMVRERGSVAIYMASALGLQRMVDMLLSVSVNVNSSTPFGRTPLHAAASKDNLAILDLLINHGASVRQTDYFGVTALDVAKDMSSSLCAKRLRLMQLNLRGNVLTSSNGRVLRKRVQTGHGHISKIDSYGSRDITSEFERSRSTTSQYSEDSVFKYISHSPLHKSRKSVSSSAPTSDTLRTSSKRMVRWKDIPKDNTYWKVMDSRAGSSSEMSDKFDLKSMAIVQQKKLLKFDTKGKKKMETKSVEVEENTAEEPVGPTNAEKAAKLTKSRLRYYKRLAENMEALKAMRRKINISASNGKSPRDSKNSEAFAKWLEKKEIELENMEEDDDSGESINHSDGEEDDTMYEFNKRVRKQNKPKIKSLTPGNRPVKDIISVGSTMAGDSSNPSTFLNANAYWEWKRGRTGQLGPRNNDVSEEKRRLEERRQKLLLSAISYDEWMDHAEDRKILIKRILQAGNPEMDRLEKERLEDKERRERMYSYDKWKAKIKERDAIDKKRRGKLRKWEEENAVEKMQFGKSASAVQFAAWLERKRQDMQREKQKTPIERNSGKRPKSDPTEVESAYQAWLVRKHNEEMTAIEDRIKRERDLLGAMRQMRASAITT